MRRSRSTLLCLGMVFALLATMFSVISAEPAAADDDKVLYLTFGNGPVRTHTTAALDLLDEYDAKATFFPVGLRVQQLPEIVSDVADAGHRIGNATMTYANFGRLTDDEVRSELRLANEAILAAAGQAPTCVRPPDGNLDNRMRRLATDEGLTPVLWDIGGSDYGAQTPQPIFNRIRSAQSGDTILLHDAAGANSIAIARLVLDFFTDQGFSFETLPECRSGATPPPVPPEPQPPTPQPPTPQPPTPQPPTPQPPTPQPPTPQPPTPQPPTPQPPTPPGPEVGPEAITVRAKGDTGTERIELRLNSATVASFDLGRNFANYTFDPEGLIRIDRLRVHFVNNDQVPEGDRNVEIDFVSVNQRIFQSEDPSVESVGSYTSGDGCRRGNKQSQRLACSGYFDYVMPPGISIGQGDPNPQPPTPQPVPPTPPGEPAIVVRAKGDLGSERIRLTVNGTDVSTWDLSKGYRNLPWSPGSELTVETVRVSFINDARVDGEDRNVDIDYISINGVVFESEAASVRSKGSWTAGTGCSIGFKQRQRIGCKGWFDYEIPAGTVIS